MKEALRACWQEREVADLGRLLVGLLLVACVWALVGCTSSTETETASHRYIEEITLRDGTPCAVVFRKTSLDVVVGGITCNWRCPR